MTKSCEQAKNYYDMLKKIALNEADGGEMTPEMEQFAKEATNDRMVAEVKNVFESGYAQLVRLTDPTMYVTLMMVRMEMGLQGEDI